MGMLPTVCPIGGVLPPGSMIGGIFHPATATGPATCGFMVTALCASLGMITPFPGSTLKCTVGPGSPGGGLPVELMDFSIEGDEAEVEADSEQSG